MSSTRRESTKSTEATKVQWPLFSRFRDLSFFLSGETYKVDSSMRGVRVRNTEVPHCLGIGEKVEYGSTGPRTSTRPEEKRFLYVLQGFLGQIWVGWYSVHVRETLWPFQWIGRVKERMSPFYRGEISTTPPERRRGPPLFDLTRIQREWEHGWDSSAILQTSRFFASVFCFFILTFEKVPLRGKLQRSGSCPVGRMKVMDISALDTGPSVAPFSCVSTS